MRTSSPDPNTPANRPLRRSDLAAEGGYGAAGEASPLQSYSREAGGDRYASDFQDRRKRRHIKRGILIAVLAIVLVAVVGSAASAAGFIGSISSRMHRGIDDSTRAMLASQQADAKAKAAGTLTEAGAQLPANWEDTTPFYMLLLGIDKSYNRTEGSESENYGNDDSLFRADTIILARIDPGNKQVTLVSIHRDTMVNIDGRDMKINAAYSLGGVSKVIEVVSEFAGVPISHFATVDIDGLSAITDAIGGVEVNVPYEINDDVLPGHLDAGVQTLDGEGALVFTRSRHAYDNLGDGDRYRAANQRAFLAALANKVLSSSPTTMVAAINSLADYVTTDLEIDRIAGLALTMKGIDTGTDIYSTMNPTDNQYINGTSYEINRTDQWRQLMATVDAGGRPDADADYIDPLNDINSNNPESDPTGDAYTGTPSSGTTGSAATPAAASTTQQSTPAATTPEPEPTTNAPANPGIEVDVRDVNGGSNAGTISAIEALGYTNVSDGGSAAGLSSGGTTYVVYEDPAYEAEAQAIAQALGGTAINGEGTWIVVGNVMVVTNAQ